MNPTCYVVEAPCFEGHHVPDWLVNTGTAIGITIGVIIGLYVSVKFWRYDEECGFWGRLFASGVWIFLASGVSAVVCQFLAEMGYYSAWSPWATYAFPITAGFVIWLLAFGLAKDL